MKSESNNTQSLGEFYLKPQIKQFEKIYSNMINDSSTNNLISLKDEDEIMNKKFEIDQSENILSAKLINQQYKSNDSSNQAYNTYQRHHLTQQNSRNIS